MAWLLLAAGLASLLIGADVLVRAVMTLAERFQLSTLFIVLTVVALGCGEDLRISSEQQVYCT